MADVFWESILLISDLLKYLIYAILENHLYGKALSKLLYLPNVFMLCIGHFVIIEKSISFLLNAGKSY